MAFSLAAAAAVVVGGSTVRESTGQNQGTVTFLTNSILDQRITRGRE